MNRRLFTILLIAFIVAAVSTFLVYRLVATRVGTRQANTTAVVAAKEDIKLGSILTADKLTSVGIAGTIPPGAILEKDWKSVIGRGVISDLYAGEPILQSRLAAAGSGGGLAALIPSGMRACAVKVDDVVNVSGFVTPGMRVDVLISGTPPGEQNSREGIVSSTLMQNIRVLSAGTDIQKDAEGKPKQVQVVNLLVTPEQAEKLSLAMNQAKIQLVLRNPLDTKITPIAATATANLYAGTNAAPASSSRRATASRKAAPQTYSVEVINGAQQHSTKFPFPGGHQ
ncbi:MAG: Flp pilus assembly protein CpaB [Terracidiphilus sp.]